MNRNKIKFIVDVLMFVDFLIVALSGFVLWRILPRGSGKAGNSFWFLREDWLAMHDWGAVLLVFFILVHLILNWVWIRSMFKFVFKK